MAGLIGFAPRNLSAVMPRSWANSGGRLNINGRMMDFQIINLFWYAALHCVGPGAIGDAAGGVRRQARAHPRFEKREIPGRHRGELWTGARRSLYGRPIIVEIRERPLHGDLPRFD